jgi:hypothetical protein
MILKSSLHHLINSILFLLNYDGFVLRCLKKEDDEMVLKELHEGPAWGHFRRETTTHNILRDGYFWKTLFRDTHVYIRRCEFFHMSAGKEKKEAISL